MCSKILNSGLLSYEIGGGGISVLNNLVGHRCHHVWEQPEVLFCGGGGPFHPVDRSQSSREQNIRGDNPVHRGFYFLPAWMSCQDADGQW